MKLGGGVLGRTLSCGTLVSVLAASALSACGDDTTSGGNAGDDGAGGERPGSGGNGGGTGGSGTGTTAWDTVSCGNRDTAEASTVSGAVTEATTWSGRVLLDGTVTVSAALTIEAGTEVLAADGSELIVNAGGSIAAEGTEDEPVTICGQSEDAGSWAGLSIEDDAAASELSYVLLSNGGSGEQALLLDGEALVGELKVTESGADGVVASTFAAESAGLSVTGAVGVPVVLTAAAAISPFPVGGDLTGNGEDVVLLEFDEIAVDTRFSKVGVPYVQEADINVVAGHLEFMAGVTLHRRTDNSHNLRVGWDGEVHFEVHGTEAEPVLFEAVDAGKSYVDVGPSVTPDSMIEHVVFRTGAAPSNPLAIGGTIGVRHLLIEQSEGGLWIRAGGAVTPESDDWTIRDVTSRGPIETDINAADTLPHSVSFANNTYNVIYLTHPLTTAVELWDFGVTYVLAEQIAIAATGDLTVPAGLSLDVYQPLTITGKVSCLGTEEKPVRISRSALIVELDSSADTTFQHVEFEDGVGGQCLTLHQPTQVSDSLFTRCGDNGISVNTTNAAAIDYQNEVTNSAIGEGTSFLIGAL